MNGLKERRSAFFDCMTENSLLLLYSGEEIPFSLDAFYPFECNHHFFYLTGLRREKMALVMSTCADKEETILFIEMPEPLKVRWTGRRVSVEEAREKGDNATEQLTLFRDYAAEEKAKQAEDAALEKERKMQEALLHIRDRYGKNSVIKGLNLQEGATALERNEQVGGHRK